MVSSVSGNQRKGEPENDDWRARAVLREFVFSSSIPIIGPLVARFRAAWNAVSTKWYVRDLAGQQSEFNLALLRRLDELQAQVDSLEGSFIGPDREGALLRHDLAELTVQVVALNRRLASLDERLAELSQK